MVPKETTVSDISAGVAAGRVGKSTNPPLQVTTALHTMSAHIFHFLHPLISRAI